MRINIDIIREDMDGDTAIPIPTGRVVIIFNFSVNEVSSNSCCYGY
jgi:hypothetical protein